MTWTREFKTTVQARVNSDPAFRASLLSEAVNLLISSDAETGKTVLRDDINATLGFERLADIIGTPPKSLMRMLSLTGSPRSENLLRIISEWQK